MTYKNQGKVLYRGQLKGLGERLEILRQIGLDNASGCDILAGMKTYALSKLDRGRLPMRMPPKGCFYAFDSLGFKIVRKSDGLDYHPTIKELSSNNPLTIMRRGLANKYNKNLQIKRQEKISAFKEAIFKKNIHSTLVTLQDSLAVGNCKQGSLEFARQNGLNIKDVLRCPWIFGLPASKIMDDPRAAKAIRRAYERETLVQI
jgi:hypothetical protein